MAGVGDKQPSPTLFVVSVLGRYNVIHPYLFIPLHFALCAITRAPTKKVTPSIKNKSGVIH